MSCINKRLSPLAKAVLHRNYHGGVRMPQLLLSLSGKMGHWGDENPDAHSSKSHGCKSVQTPLRFLFLFLTSSIPWSTLTLISFVNSIYWQNLHCWRHLWSLCFPASKYHPAGMGSTINSWSTASYRTSTLPWNFSTISTQAPTLHKVKWRESHSAMSDSLWPHRLHSLWNSPGQNTGVGSLSLLQGIFPSRDRTQVSRIAGGFFTSWAIREAHSS